MRVRFLPLSSFAVVAFICTLSAGHGQEPPAVKPPPPIVPLARAEWLPTVN